MREREEKVEEGGKRETDRQTDRYTKTENGEHKTQIQTKNNYDSTVR